jgi:coiled-coil domain-containing protein 55
VQQEEVQRTEGEESKREIEEEEGKRKGGGTSCFYQVLLKRDEERSWHIAKTAQEAAARPKTETVEEEVEDTDAQLAEKLKENGAHILVNDGGEIVDKRQLLSAGSNVAKKPKSAIEGADKAAPAVTTRAEYSRSTAAYATRRSQRERQTRMMTARLEEMAQKQAEQDAEEQKALKERVKSKKTGTDILSTRERYLA